MEELKQEIKIRKRISHIFNKTIDDFHGNKKDYDDFLEMVEDIILNLRDNVNVRETEVKVAEYERANRQAIVINQAKQAEERRRQIEQAQASTADKSVVEPSAMDIAQLSQPSSQPVFCANFKMDENGTLVPKHSNLLRKPEVLTACGWSSEYVKKRAFQEAFGAIFIS